MFTDPVKNLKMLGLSDDMIVADLGAGTGFYSIAAAHMLPRGKVYAIDVQKDFLKTIKNKADEAKLSNLECLWGDAEEIGGTKLADSIVDVALVSNLFCQAEDRRKLILEIKRILKNNGRALLVELTDDSPLVSKKFNRCISPEQSLELFLSQGFKLDRKLDVGDHHYGMIFEKA